jgi:hypothetical protein
MDLLTPRVTEMATRPPRRDHTPACEPLERRSPLDGVGLVSAAWGIYNSPLVSTARTVVLGYKAAQLAWTGHTSLLFGAVRVSQPFALDSLVHGHAQGHAGSPHHHDHGHWHPHDHAETDHPSHDHEHESESESG